MRGYIDRDAIDTRGEISPVVQIKATQEILIGFPAPTVLGDDHARHDLQDFAWTYKWPRFELGLAHPTFGGRPGNPREIISPAGHDYGC
jgi:hypothetical protein